jgi:hypothetical protein
MGQVENDMLLRDCKTKGRKRTPSSFDPEIFS